MKYVIVFDPDAEKSKLTISELVREAHAACFYNCDNQYFANTIDDPKAALDALGDIYEYINGPEIIDEPKTYSCKHCENYESIHPGVYGLCRVHGVTVWESDSCPFKLDPELIK